MLAVRLTPSLRSVTLLPIFPHSVSNVEKAFGLIVRRINDEPFDKPSVPGSRAVTIKFMIPNSRMGSVIGKGGSKIKEIQDASGARLNASDGMLPGSTEVCRLLLGFILYSKLEQFQESAQCFRSCGRYSYRYVLHRKHLDRGQRTNAFICKL